MSLERGNNRQDVFFVGEDREVYQAMLREEAARALDDPAEGSSVELLDAPEEATTVDPDGPSAMERRPRAAWALPAAVVAVALLALLVPPFLFYPPAEEEGAVVHVSSEPSGATLYLDGQRQPSATPAVIAGVARGRHELALVLEGFERQERSFDVASSQVELNYQLRPAVGRADVGEESPEPDGGTRSGPDAGGGDSAADAPDGAAPRPGKRPVRPPRPDRSVPVGGQAFLNLMAVPAAKVWINGQAAGQTPLMRRSIPAGPVTVRLEPMSGGVSKTIRFRAMPGKTVSRRVSLVE